MKKILPALVIFLCSAFISLDSLAITVVLIDGTTIECTCDTCTAGSLSDAWNHVEGDLVCCNRGTPQEKCFNKKQIKTIGMPPIGGNTTNPGDKMNGIITAIGLVLIALAIFFKKR